MSATSAITRGRTLAESLMVDTCTIRRRTGEVTDPFSGTITPTYANVYVGKCKVQQHQAQARAEDAGEDFLLMLMMELHVPMDGTAGIRPDDEVLIGTSTLDVDLPGRVLYVRDVFHKSLATARRMSVQERTS